ncbi:MULTISPECIES: efflux RND transporter periplasmic adaptor subunit [Cryobacterium]|uniref:Biotin/lipoyl-binding protein n=2 Tax=Cryobacterium TaxID=69578 RepID=A0ABY2IL59_9MICO|nr:MULTISPECIES: biotin/lipoyl-binding protein [Cryobacterium]MDY7529379.1 biotin/lipoyl-binding protein [Cryobacterium sp. 10C2]MEB0203498.1 biotin/lipoyl-binding protein [Cryobacterium sp. 5I3]MEB0292093.1 biotin/lipoyl-binding protein [Cryobacterium sp. 10C2]TFB94368.1 biotin/lipoyl-binding protein [Cryobacterium sp. MDB2-A-1]TFC06184.1 biotin/lipoyl-binding protein [Cryobacterium sp. MDB2-33-2]
MKRPQFLTHIRPRTWVVAGVIVLALAGGSIYWFGFAVPANTKSTVAAPITTAASLTTMQKTVDSDGTATPTVNDSVSFAVSGTVTAVPVVAGTTVTAGQVLATVDTLSLDAAVLEAQATLATAKAKLATSVSDSDGTAAAVAQIAAQTASVAVDEAAVVTAQAAVAGATLTAPAAGLVTAVNVAVGDVISSGSSGSSGAGGATTASTASTSTSTADFSIVGTDSWSLSLAIGESDIANVAVNDQVELSLDDGTAFFGTVQSVGILPSTTSGAVTYPVVVAVTGDPDGLYDGVAVTAKIVYERRTNVLTVPSAAVTTADGVSTVKTLDASGTAVATTVTVGETVGNVTEILTGIAEGDEVVVVTFTPGSGNSGSTTDRQSGGSGGFPSGGPPSGGMTQGNGSNGG